MDLPVIISQHGFTANACRILASSTHADLPVSDVGLPGMNGCGLAEIARSHRPQLPILFITGYAENATIRAGLRGTNTAYTVESVEEAARHLEALGVPFQRGGAVIVVVDPGGNTVELR
jgi:CheY-like chemotaxis protein